MGRTMQVRDWARRIAQTVHVATSKALLKHVMNVDSVICKTQSLAKTEKPGYSNQLRVNQCERATDQATFTWC